MTEFQEWWKTVYREKPAAVNVNEKLMQEYLSNGGLFNPEMMEHDKVRDMIVALFSHRGEGSE